MGAILLEGMRQAAIVVRAIVGHPSFGDCSDRPSIHMFYIAKNIEFLF
jgi:hypothetical protein